MGDESAKKSSSVLEALQAEVTKAMEGAKSLQDSASSFISQNASEEQSLRHRAQSLDSTIRRLRAQIYSLPHDVKALDPKLSDKLEEDLHRATCILTDGDAGSFLPPKAHGGFLRMFLGPINVRSSSKDIQLKVKEEYNAYRLAGSFCHGLTYSGHPVACAVAVEALKIYRERNIVEQVKSLAPKYKARSAAA